MRTVVHTDDDLCGRALAELARARGNRLTSKPADVSFERAAGIPISG